MTFCELTYKVDARVYERVSIRGGCMVQPKIQELARLIRTNTYQRKVIFLQQQNITDDDVTALFEAINDNPEYRACLEDINLANNQITKFPSLVGFHSLKYLVLSNNRIDHIEGFPQLYNLAFIDVSNNRLKTMPSMARLTRLKEVYLHQNPLQTLPQLPSFKRLEIFSADPVNMKYFSKIICEKLQDFVPNLCYRLKVEISKKSTQTVEIEEMLIQETAEQFLRDTGKVVFKELHQQITDLIESQHPHAALLSYLVPVTFLEEKFYTVLYRKLQLLSECLQGHEKESVEAWLNIHGQRLSEKMAWQTFKEVYQFSLNQINGELLVESSQRENTQDDKECTGTSVALESRLKGGYKNV